MPTSTASRYQFAQDSTFARLDRSGSVGQYLKQRWQSFAPDSRRWTMWDVALLQAYLSPGQATEVEVTTPPENTRRTVWMYTDIDASAMAENFWNRLLSYE